MGSQVGSVAAGGGNTVDTLTAGGWLDDIVKLRPPKDPIHDIQEEFIRDLTIQQTAIHTERIPGPVKEISTVLKDAPQGSILLEFTTDSWGVRQAFLDVYYVLWYRAIAKIVRLSDNKLLWQGVCRVGSTSDGPHIIFDDIVENDGLALQSQLKNISRVCVEQLRSQFGS